ncbi:MAG: P-type conjugative transfer protein VirB9 (plasmid) [Candidatus Symbiodolus clandestinus]
MTIKVVYLFIIFKIIFHNTMSLAACLPKGSVFDNRIQYVDYNPSDIVEIKALKDLSLRIVFSKEETITDCSVSFSEGWEIKKNKNILYIKPLPINDIIPNSKDWSTNLMVTTSFRLYDFDLRIVENKSHSSGTYRIEFRYPKEQEKIAKESTREQNLSFKFNQLPRLSNWKYSMQVAKNSSKIAPTMACDDGRFTYLRFPNNREIPAVFLRSEDKTESIVNTHTDNDILVIHRITKTLILRLGNAVVAVHNENFDKDGVAPNQATTIPDIKRIIKPHQP